MGIQARGVGDGTAENDPAPLIRPLTHQETNPMASLRKRGRVWYFRYSDADGVKHEEKGCTDRRVTEELARTAESEAARIKAGVFDAKELVLRDHAARSLENHITEYHSRLTAKGVRTKHARQMVLYARRVASVAKIDPTWPTWTQAASKKP
jgi:hypothetical protein